MRTGRAKDECRSVGAESDGDWRQRKLVNSERCKFCLALMRGIVKRALIKTARSCPFSAHVIQ